MIVGLYSTVEEVLILIIASSRRLQTGLTGASGKRLRSLARAPTSKLCKRTAMALRRFRASNRGWRTIGTLRQQQIKASSVVRSSVCRTTHCYRAERWHDGVTRNRIKATRPTILLSHIHLHRSNTDMGIRDSFSRSKKKFKHLLTGRKHKSGGTGTETGGESVSSVGSVPRPVPHIVAGGSHDLEDDGGSAGGSAGLAHQFPQQIGPELGPAHGGETGQEGGEADVDRGEVGQKHLHPDSDIEATVGSGPGREGNDIDEVRVEQVHPSPSTPPIPHSGKPDGM